MIEELLNSYELSHAERSRIRERLRDLRGEIDPRELDLYLQDFLYRNCNEEGSHNPPLGVGLLTIAEKELVDSTLEDLSSGPGVTQRNIAFQITMDELERMPKQDSLWGS